MDALALGVPLPTMKKRNSVLINSSDLENNILSRNRKFRKSLSGVQEIEFNNHNLYLSSIDRKIKFAVHKLGLLKNTLKIISRNNFTVGRWKRIVKTFREKRNVELEDWDFE